MASFSLLPSLVSGRPHGGAGAAVGAGSDRLHFLEVKWENSGALSPPAVSKGGVAGAIYANEDIGTTTVNGITVYWWKETEIAGMSGTALAESVTAFPAASAYSEFTLQDCADTVTTYAQASSTSEDYSILSCPAGDVGIILETFSTTGIRLSSTTPTNYTSAFDADSGGSSLGSAFRYHLPAISGTIGLNNSGVSTRSQALALSFMSGTQVVATPVAVSDTASLQLAGESVDGINYTSPDTARLQISDVVSIYVTSSINDTASLNLSDAGGVTIANTQSVAVSDTASLAASDASAVAVTVDVTDTADIEVDDASTLDVAQVAKSTSDTASISLADFASAAGSADVAIVSGDAVSLHLEDAGVVRELKPVAYVRFTPKPDRIVFSSP